MKVKAKLSSMTKQTDDGKELRVEIRQISNGYIVKQSINYRDAKDNYHYMTKETFMEKDPFMGDSDEDNDKFNFNDVDLKTFKEGY